MRVESLESWGKVALGLGILAAAAPVVGFVLIVIVPSETVDGILVLALVGVVPVALCFGLAVRAFALRADDAVAVDRAGTGMLFSLLGAGLWLGVVVLTLVILANSGLE